VNGHRRGGLGLGDDEAEAYALVGLSRVALRDGDYAEVVGLAERARALVRDDRDASVAPLHMQAAGTRLLGRYDEARALYEESLVLNRSRGDARMTAMELHNLMHVELHRGDVAAAERRFEEWRSMVGASADPYDGAMWSLNNAAFAVVRGDPKRATESELRDEAEERLAAAGIVLDPDDASELHHLRTVSS
jgi:ATP/maltotriose-dependent transcriptional regulator MalT